MLVGGSHVDAMRGGNPLIQFSQQLVSGFSKPQNVEAAQILMVGWINDMFAGSQDDGIYADPGEAVHDRHPCGQATAVALPSSLTKPFLLNLLQPFVALGNALLHVRTDVRSRGSMRRGHVHGASIGCLIPGGTRC